MSTKIRARVAHRRFFDFPGIDPWIASLILPDGLKLNRLPRRHATAASHAEAMQAAHKMIADLDAQLMDEMHASQSKRRAEREAKLAAESEPSPTPTHAERIANIHDLVVARRLDPPIITPAQIITTTEATA